jgi:putative transcriptional regulator
MKWNLRLAAANRGVWKTSELRRLLADRGMEMSVGKLSGLWSGDRTSCGRMSWTRSVRCWASRSVT